MYSAKRATVCQMGRKERRNKKTKGATNLMTVQNLPDIEKKGRVGCLEVNVVLVRVVHCHLRTVGGRDVGPHCLAYKDVSSSDPSWNKETKKPSLEANG